MFVKGHLGAPPGPLAHELINLRETAQNQARIKGPDVEMLFDLRGMPIAIGAVDLVRAVTTALATSEEQMRALARAA